MELTCPTMASPAALTYLVRTRVSAFACPHATPSARMNSEVGVQVVGLLAGEGQPLQKSREPRSLMRCAECQQAAHPQRLAAEKPFRNVVPRHQSALAVGDEREIGTRRVTVFDFGLKNCGAHCERGFRPAAPVLYSTVSTSYSSVSAVSSRISSGKLKSLLTCPPRAIHRAAKTVDEQNELLHGPWPLCF